MQPRWRRFAPFWATSSTSLDLVRRGLATSEERPPVRLETFSLGLRLDISNVADALEIAEGIDRH